MDSPVNIKPSARKTHRKTRTGCRTCKARKIKCDEQRPSCHNCIKHSVQCDFLVTASTGSAAGLSHSSETPANRSPHLSQGTPYFDQNGEPSNDAGLPGLNLTDLELLHNYTTSTAFTLHTDPGLKILWRINVAQLGFQNDFVMRGILALSALHLARFRPERRDFYMSQAIMQHQTGLRMATGLLSDITKENCTAIYLFSALTLFFTLASPRKPGDFLLVGENGIADWLYLVRGTNYIIESSEEFLFSGPLGPMFMAGRRRAELKERILAETNTQDDPLDELGVLISGTSSDHQNIPIYMSAIHTLRKSFVFHNKQAPPGHETGDIFFWVFRVPDEYLALLKQHSQESLAIFAYFCVVLKRLDAHWWMEGWSVHLISKIWTLLDEEHRLWIRWPIEEIGWIPS